MDRKLKTWELALMLGVLMAVVAGGWLGQEQRELADSVIRFHVIANSDSEADQALEAGHFTPEQGALVTGADEGYVLKFKAMEWLGELQEFF